MFKNENKTNNQLKSKAEFLHLEVSFPLKELHSMADIPRVRRVNWVKMTLAKISPGICMSKL